MGVFYIPKSGKRKEKKPYSLCRYCKAKIMWAVNPFRKNVPIEYDPGLEYLYDGISKVNFIPGAMTEHFKNCKYKKHFKN